MNYENSKTSEPRVLILKLTDKLDLKRGEKSVALSNLKIYYTWKDIKNSYNNNKFKISAPIWNDKFELSDGSYSVSDIQHSFEHILKKHNKNIDNPSIKIFVNKIKNRITFKMNIGYYRDFLTPETIKLPGSTKNKIAKDKNRENVPTFEITEVVLVHYNIVNNDTNKIRESDIHLFWINQLVNDFSEMSPKNHKFLKTFNSKFQAIKV